MNAPDSLRRIEDEDGIVREYNYGDEHVIVIDFGEGYGDATIDIIEDTAIVVIDGDGGDDGDEKVEFDLPTDATDVTANNGILTITA